LVNKSFITDCEGPISLNDNAFELCSKFIDNGEEFFKIISKYDDYLVDVIHRENYNAGDTLKLIVPFFKAYGITNENIINFSKKNISLVEGAEETMRIAKKSIDSFIVSTSYGQYIESLCNLINFPFKNTFFTCLDMDRNIYNNCNIDIDGEDVNNSYNMKEDEKELMFLFKDTILKGDFNEIDKIFFDKIPKMEVYNLMETVKTVGGEGKKLAIEKILGADLNLDPYGIMYVGDSITDVEPLRFVNEHNGISISFNGNEYALKEAEIAIISEHTIVTSILIDLHSRFNKDYVMEFVRSYSINPKRAFESFRIKFQLIDKFNEVFNSKELPTIQIIDSGTIEKLTEKSIAMRKKIRGTSIGELG
jgi:energy-converting hydrogenase A subunit R